MIFPAGPALLAAAGEFVHRGPSSRLRRFHAGTALLITGFDVRRLPLLLVGITGFIALRHGGFLIADLAPIHSALRRLVFIHNFSINDRFFIFLAFVVIVI